jgi:hypothetical protein
LFADVDPGETLALSSEQLSMLIDGVDWRALERGRLRFAAQAPAKQSAIRRSPPHREWRPHAVGICGGRKPTADWQASGGPGFIDPSAGASKA